MDNPAKVSRRVCLGAAVAALAGRSLWPATRRDEKFASLSAYSVIPVVGDGKWIWTEPPGETGYLEPRDYELKVGVQLEGQGLAKQVIATTPVPSEFPEQSINEANIRSDGCDAAIRRVSNDAAQLAIAAPEIEQGQVTLTNGKKQEIVKIGN